MFPGVRPSGKGAGRGATKWRRSARLSGGSGESAWSFDQEDLWSGTRDRCAEPSRSVLAFQLHFALLYRDAIFFSEVVFFLAVPRAYFAAPSCVTNGNWPGASACVADMSRRDILEK